VNCKLAREPRKWLKRPGSRVWCGRKGAGTSAKPGLRLGDATFWALGGNQFDSVSASLKTACEGFIFCGPSVEEHPSLFFFLCRDIWGLMTPERIQALQKTFIEVDSLFASFLVLIISKFQPRTQKVSISISGGRSAKMRSIA
jgi:hypothetical protein